MLAAALTIACASQRGSVEPGAPSDAAPTASSPTPNPAAFRIPEMREVPPDRLFIDLGPVFLELGKRPRPWVAGFDPSDPVFIEADHLGADGFIIEHRSLSKTYAVSCGAFSTGTLLDVPIAVIVTLLSLPELIGHRPEEQTFLRAFRYVRSPLPRVLLDGDRVVVPEETLALLNNAEDLTEQFNRLHQSLVAGKTSMTAYLELRFYLCRASLGLPPV
jgi:hypothetical protein